MTRVAHFLHRVPPEYSGAGLQALALIRELERQGRVESRVVAYAMNPRATLPLGTTPCSVVPLRAGLLGKARQYAALFQALLRTRARILHVHGYHRPALFSGWLLGKRIVLKTTMVGVDDLASLYARGALDRFLASRATSVVSLSERLSAANRSHAGEVLIPNGVDLERFRPMPADPATRKDAGIEADALLFLYTGGDNERKGFERLPEMWARIRRGLGDLRPHLLVAGLFRRADSADRLRQRLRGPDVSVRGELIHDMRPWLATSDVLLFPSTQEGLPNAVLEAVAMDVFVLARHLEQTYTGILDDGNSLVFEEFTDDTVARLRQRLLDGTRPIDNAAFRAQFDLARIGRAYGDLYRSLSA